MSQFFRAVALAALIAIASVTASPHKASADANADSRAVIEQQLDAFSRDAWQEAFTYASPNIRNIFGNAKTA